LTSDKKHKKFKQISQSLVEKNAQQCKEKKGENRKLQKTTLGGKIKKRKMETRKSKEMACSEIQTFRHFLPTTASPPAKKSICTDLANTKGKANL